MDIENDIENNPESTSEPTEIYPDGFGMSLDNIRAMILNQYNIKVDKDDPVLMFIPILNAFLYEQQKLQEEYKEGLKEVYQEVLKAFIVEFEEKATKGIDVKVTHTGDNKQGDNKQLTIIVQYVLIVALSLTLATIYFWKF